MVPAAGNRHAESDRLAALRRYAILDTPPEVEFDELVARAVRETGYPTALFSLMDEERCWFKAAVGLKPADAGIRELPRCETFCQHAFHSSGTFVVGDAPADPRFARLAVVNRPDGYRAYVGAQIITPDGHSLGTLCVLDGRPREPTAVEHAALRRLADDAMALLERRRQRLADRLPARGRPLAIVAEDDSYVRVVAAEMLKHLGYAVLEAADGTAALETFRANRESVELVLTDFNMPGCDGLVLARTLQAEGSRAQVVMMSGRFDSQVRAAVLAAGVTCLLTKPFTIDALRAATMTSNRSG
ncbi:MAG TPA: response regulator [Opitutaceae bacterium]|nr:response regulator [Opitutaceae bacterium]